MNTVTANDNDNLSANDQIVASAAGFEFTRGELHAAFTKVEDKQNWKQPIDAFLPAVTSEREIAAVEQAVIFFAGCVARIDTLPLGGYRVRAAGYYRSVGA